MERFSQSLSSFPYFSDNAGYTAVYSSRMRHIGIVNEAAVFQIMLVMLATT